MAKRRRRRRINRRKLLVIVVLLLLIFALVFGIFKIKKFFSKDKKLTTPDTTEVVDNQTNDTKKDTEPEPVDTRTDLEKLYYYDESRKDRYEAYQQKHPEFTYDEVCWRVDCDIDLEHFQDIKYIDPSKENDVLLLVNKHFRFRDEYTPEELVYFYGDYRCTPATKVAWDEMYDAAVEDDIWLDVCSAYRSMETQANLYYNIADAYGTDVADLDTARPGSSEHHTGRAIDLIGPTWVLEDFEYCDASDWIKDNAYKYGFILRYGKDIVDITGYVYESWHITYVGKDVAKTMHDQKIKSFEEYYVKYVMYKPN